MTVIDLDAYYLSEQDPKDPPKTVPNGPVEPRTLELEGPDGHAQEADITLSNLTLSEVPFPAQAQTGHEMSDPVSRAR